MRRILIMAAVLLSAISCGRNDDSKILILYYSQSGTTKSVAEVLQKRLSADMEAIVPLEPYDGDYQATIERGRKELEADILPDIQAIASGISAYDVIFLGFPVWFGTYARPIATLLAAADFSGKKVVPFCTFGSGGLESSVKNIREKQPDAEVLDGYGIRAARIDAVAAELDCFLKTNGFIAGESEPLLSFPESRPVTEEESNIFDIAVGDYPMIRAKAEEVASRPVPGGTEYLFTARNLPADIPGRDAPQDRPVSRTIKVYVLAEDGRAPVFTQVVR